MYITTPDGRQVPLNSVADMSASEYAPTLIEHDGLRAGGLDHRLLPQRPERQARPWTSRWTCMMHAMAKLNFPPGYGLEVRGDMTQMMDTFTRLLRGLGLALIFIFLVLVAQFRGFLQPLQMVFSLPLELAGRLPRAVPGAPGVLHGLDHGA